MGFQQIKKDEDPAPDGQEPERVLAAMSGGVDSSVAAMLLVEKGLEVTGITLRLPFYGSEKTGGACCGTSGMEDARKVCRRLGIKHYVLDYREIFKRTVLKNFFDQYRTGRTPNPCVRCNEWIKFGALLETAEAMGTDAVATGHYVRKRYNGDTGRCELLTGRKGEDQSYFLFSLSQSRLSRAVFPLGELTKVQVRKMARRAGLRTHDSPKSQDLCFLPDGRYGDLIGRECPDLLTDGDVVHVSGRKLGRHRGIALYTVGQRRGLGIAWREPLYVVDIDHENNRLVVGEKRHVRRTGIVVGELNWISPPPEDGLIRAGVRIRFRHPRSEASLRLLQNGRVSVQFDRAQTAPAPGQAAVFYSGDRVLGGGFIEKTPLLAETQGL